MITVPGVAPDMIASNLEPYRPIHPGEVLKDEVEYRGLSQRRLAAKMGIPHVALLRMQTCYNAQAARKSKTVEALIQRGKNRAYRITPVPDGGVAKSRPLFDFVKFYS
jgi:hypothetical protein